MPDVRYGRRKALRLLYEWAQGKDTTMEERAAFMDQIITICGWESSGKRTKKAVEESSTAGIQKVFEDSMSKLGRRQGTPTAT